MLIRLAFIVIGIFLGCNINVSDAAQSYFGTKIGDLSELHHALSGTVYAVDSRTLFLKNFNYDGEGPAAYFYVGNSGAPSNTGGFRLRDERGGTGPLPKYRNKDITLSLPEGKTLRDVRWFSVWCDEFSVNFGDVKISRNLDFPRPTKIAPLNGVHDVSSDPIVIVDAQTLLIPNFSYDGEAPDAKFWVGRGPKPSPNGVRIPDENGKEVPLRRYDKKTIVLTLPGDLTVFEIGHFGVWCEAFTVDFGHVRIPDQINVPPSLKMLGISPQSKLNCEVLNDELAFEVRWAVAGESVVIQLVAKLEDGEYMSFGVSPDINESRMIGGDVAVVWVDKATGKGYAQDYYLDAKSQCSGLRGSCPDTRFNENSNSIRLLNAAMVNGYSIVTYQRPLKTSDQFDLPIYTNESQAILWAIGPLNQRYEVSYHSSFLKKTKLIEFGRQPFWNCPTPESEQKVEAKDSEDYNKNSQLHKLSNEGNRRNGPGNYFENDRIDRPTQKPKPKPTPKPVSKNGAWDIPPIQCYEPEDGVFYAQMGPTGGKQGYPAITGHVGWGISWYINGLLIPEINVVRGKTYTFVVEGGQDPETPAKYHPFYISDDAVGGYEHQSEEDQQNIEIFAGVHRSRSGKITPTGVGRLCTWTPDPDGPQADAYPSFGAYQRSLTLKCEEGEPGIITWTPDHNTPDTVYYQCFTHRYLGWKINVLDSCEDAQPSEVDEVYTDPEENFDAEPSIRHESKLLPNDNFLQQHEKDLIKHHNMNGGGPKFDLEKSPEMSQIIADGILAAEELEQSLKNNQTLLNSFTSPRPENAGNPLPTFNDTRYPISRPIGSMPPGLPIFIRPPFGNPMFRPGQLPMRRPISPERRPLQQRPPRPYILPQPSMIVNHYQKLNGPHMRPYFKKPPMPNKPVMMLGEPTEIKPMRKQQSKPPKHTIPELPPTMGHFHHPEPIALPIRQHTKKPYLPQNFKPQQKSAHKPLPSFHAEQQKQQEIHHPIIPPINNGFEPSSVVVESGFRPILNNRRSDVENEYENNEDEQTIERRHDEAVEIDHEIDEAIESDALFLSSEAQSQHFEPMFIPSPLDSVALAQTKNKVEVKEIVPNRVVEKLTDDDAVPKMSEKLTGDLKDMKVEDGEDKMAVANDRVDAFYLPPESRNVIKIYPEGSVVTYDGKAVLDTSLLNAPSIHFNRKDYPSKTEQFIRETPQFGPFRGEIPPINDYIAPETIIGQKISIPSSNLAFSPLNLPNHDNDVENEKPISTKLSILKPEKEKSRTKRDAHHHPDHKGDSHDDGWTPPQSLGSMNVASLFIISIANLILLCRRV